MRNGDDERESRTALASELNLIGDVEGAVCGSLAFRRETGVSRAAELNHVRGGRQGTALHPQNGADAILRTSRIRSLVRDVEVAVVGLSATE